MWKALLVDDEEAIRTLFSVVLEKVEFSVRPVESAASAIRLLQSEVFDVVITDLRMESMFAGYEVCRFAHQLEPRPLVVILTAFPVSASEWQAVGADALFTKGPSTLGLATALRDMIECRGAPREKNQTHDLASVVNDVVGPPPDENSNGKTLDPQHIQSIILGLLKAIVQERDPDRLEALQQRLDEKRVELAKHLSHHT